MWQASLRIEIARRQHCSVLAGTRHTGPLRVQRPFYPEPGPDGACHVYVLHPPGGVVGGDELDIEIDVQRHARGLLTTPAATKFYRSERRWARQRQHLRVGPEAALEWLPQENIFFDDCWSRLETRVELDRSAAFVGWEISCLGRPAAGEAFDRGACIQRWEIYREGRLTWMDRSAFEGGSERLRAAWGLAGFSASGTLVCVPAGASAQPGKAAVTPELVSLLRERAAGFSAADRHGITSFGDVLLCRYLGSEAQVVRRALTELWMLARPHIIGREAVPPRIWAT